MVKRYAHIPLECIKFPKNQPNSSLLYRDAKLDNFIVVVEMSDLKFGDDKFLALRPDAH